MRFLSNTNNSTQTLLFGIGNLISFSFAIISSAILSRYLDKIEYGTYRQIIYIYNILLIIFTAGLPRAYQFFLPKQNLCQGKDIIIQLTKVLFLLGILFSLFLYFFSGFISSLLNNSGLDIGLKAFSLIPFLLLPTLGLEGIYSNLRSAKIITIYTLVSRLLMLVCITIPVIFFKTSYLGAIYGWTISSVITLVYALFLKTRPYKNIVRTKSDYNIKDILKYSLPLMFASLYGIGIKFSDQFFISRYFGAEVFAEFANGYIELPFVIMATSAITTVLMPQFTKIIHEKRSNSELVEIWKKAITKTAIFIYPLLIFFEFFSKETIVLLFGSAYNDSSIYFNLILTINFFNIIVFSPILLALGESRIYSNIHLIFLLIIWPLEYIAVILFKNPLSVVIISVFVNVTLIVVFIFIISHKLKIKIIDFIPFSDFIKIILLSTILVILSKFIFFGLFNFSLIISYILSFLFFIIILLLTSSIININYISNFRMLFYK